jgi:hypothetical protein
MNDANFNEFEFDIIANDALFPEVPNTPVFPLPPSGPVIIFPDVPTHTPVPKELVKPVNKKEKELESLRNLRRLRLREEVKAELEKPPEKKSIFSKLFGCFPSLCVPR